MSTTDLGKRIYSQNVVLRGRLDGDKWECFLVECGYAMNMTSAGKASVWRYPTHDGKGGLGATICQPITESFLVIDTWPDHDGAYLHISSCKKFHVADLVETIRHFGLAMDFAGVREELKLA